MYRYIVTADIIILISGSLGHFHSRDHYMCHPHQVKKHHQVTFVFYTGFWSTVKLVI